MMRRTFLMAGVSLSAVAVGKSLAASVFLDYTQEQLDTAYDQSFWAPRMAELEEGDGIASAEVRRAMPPRPAKYGPDARDLIDVFAPGMPRPPRSWSSSMAVPGPETLARMHPIRPRPSFRAGRPMPRLTSAV
ncbi:MAG: hypothetical protein E5X09_08895 [Mesorhizobium sp.]|uniref:hypothetical protein n=1 Tax=unclassified Mesorhizobium TaxID=325217 RepID=UPI00121CFB90|nr:MULTISPECIES: hypothetical protein [unclassified Mesorhizobium]TIS13107.1 MAG: hypothetical protein E5X09_08895 [Mesorhizobium sp.]TIS79374.1 MAG: hypothetical protein E5W99_20775 [Mesorhizobium sp.]TIX06469.1 MAG: hypothetical protein E5V46_29485 [Mesorhizobium sp.]